MSKKYTAMASRRREVVSPQKSNSTSIIIVVIVIFSVVGFIWLLSRNGEEDEVAVSEQEQEEETGEVEGEEVDSSGEEEEIVVDVTEKESDSDAFDIPESENFSTDAQSIGEEGGDNVNITNLDQTGYEGFYRLVFTIEGSTLPYTTTNIDLSTNSINLVFNSINNDKSNIAPGNGADVSGSVISTVFHEVTSEEYTAKYVIGVKEETGFYLHTTSDPLRIIVDIQEQDVANGDGEEFAFSTDPQTIEGDATGNEIKINGLSHSNQSDVFRIIWRLGTVGTGTVPNAETELVDYEGGKAIELVISSLSNDFPAQNNYDETYTSNAVTGLKGSFLANVSTYYIKLTSQREYQLYYRTAPAQLIVDVKR